MLLRSVLVLLCSTSVTLLAQSFSKSSGLPHHQIKMPLHQFTSLAQRTMGLNSPYGIPFSLNSHHGLQAASQVAAQHSPIPIPLAAQRRSGGGGSGSSQDKILSSASAINPAMAQMITQNGVSYSATINSKGQPTIVAIPLYIRNPNTQAQNSLFEALSSQVSGETLKQLQAIQKQQVSAQSQVQSQSSIASQSQSAIGAGSSSSASSSIPSYMNLASALSGPAPSSIPSIKYDFSGMSSAAPAGLKIQDSDSKYEFALSKYELPGSSSASNAKQYVQPAPPKIQYQEIQVNADQISGQPQISSKYIDSLLAQAGYSSGSGSYTLQGSNFAPQVAPQKQQHQQQQQQQQEVSMQKTTAQVAGAPQLFQIEESANGKSIQDLSAALEGYDFSKLQSANGMYDLSSILGQSIGGYQQEEQASAGSSQNTGSSGSQQQAPSSGLSSYDSNSYTLTSEIQQPFQIQNQKQNSQPSYQSSPSYGSMTSGAAYAAQALQQAQPNLQSPYMAGSYSTGQSNYDSGKDTANLAYDSGSAYANLDSADAYTYSGPQEQSYGKQQQQAQQNGYMTVTEAATQAPPQIQELLERDHECPYRKKAIQTANALAAQIAQVQKQQQVFQNELQSGSGGKQQQSSRDNYQSAQQYGSQQQSAQQYQQPQQQQQQYQSAPQQQQQQNQGYASSQQVQLQAIQSQVPQPAPTAAPTPQQVQSAIGSSYSWQPLSSQLESAVAAQYSKLLSQAGYGTQSTGSSIAQPANSPPAESQVAVQQPQPTSSSSAKSSKNSSQNGSSSASASLGGYSSLKSLASALTSSGAFSKQLDSDEIDPSKLDLKIVHLPVSVLKRLVGNGDLALPSFQKKRK